jgi:hypothetical protein
MKLFLVLFITVAFTTFCYTQVDSNAAKISWQCYLETYYSHDASMLQTKLRPNYIYSYNRQNEVNINLGYIKAAISHSKYRGNFALMTGTYANANLANEPGLLRAIFEANLGLRLSKKHQLWLDMGVMPSHIGFESAIGKDCWTLTRSLVADNSPYFETGAKLNYTSANKKWYLAALLLNGWQRIAMPAGYNQPTFGHQLVFKPNQRVVISSNSFVGTALPDSMKQNRIYHNLYAIIELSKQLGVIGGVDNGWQESATDRKKIETWFSPVVIVKYSPVKNFALAARAEYYADSKQVVITSNTPNGFQTFGYSLNCDYSIADNFVVRLEARRLTSKDAVFISNGTTAKNNLCFTAAMALSF